VYDHVLGADRDRPGGFKGAYDRDVAFHEPLTFFAFAAAVTTSLELVSCVMILPQRQTVLVAKQAAEVAVLSANRRRLGIGIGIGIGWNLVEYLGLNESFRDRGRRPAERVELMRRLWAEPSLELAGRFHTIDRAGINPAHLRRSRSGLAARLARRSSAAPGSATAGSHPSPLGTPNDPHSVVSPDCASCAAPSTIL
jgi:alkanesulfonate monooxygenase SsuD/methylene tetrahydromethanopterin reductase-like flavin-dependent oxidoreductase (luciferase family)